MRKVCQSKNNLRFLKLRTRQKKTWLKNRIINRLERFFSTFLFACPLQHVKVFECTNSEFVKINILRKRIDFANIFENANISKKRTFFRDHLEKNCPYLRKYQ